MSLNESISDQSSRWKTIVNSWKIKIKERENEANVFLNDRNNNNLLFPIKLRESFDISKNILENFLRRSKRENLNMNEALQADATNLLQNLYDLSSKADNHDSAVRSRFGGNRVGGKSNKNKNRKRTNKRKKGRNHGKTGKTGKKNIRNRTRRLI